MNLGRFGEKLACRYLERKGFVLCDKNWYCRWGELDLVMYDSHTLVFVEVKTRKTKNLGYSVESLHSYKLRKLRRTINFYLYEKFPPQSIPLWRLDAVCINFIEGHWDILHYRALELVE